MRGVFISLEGPDGAGKTTTADYIEQLLSEVGYVVIRTREPGGTELSEMIRKLLLSEEMCSKTELLLFAASRAEHLERKIKPAIEEGKIILCDRFADSSFAYQGYGRGLLEDVKLLEEYVLNGFEPDYTIFFDIPLEVSLERLAFRFNQQDRLDKEMRDFKERVFLGYRQRFEDNPHRMVRINANQTPEEVREEVREWIFNSFITNNPL